MHAVMNVLLNRAKENGTSVYAEVYRPLQFSSMSYQHDPQLLKQPEPNDPMWSAAKTLAISASSGVFEDITLGATSYYATSMDSHPPGWGQRMIPTVVIGAQRFFKKSA
jgi:hypothetical protein